MSRINAGKMNGLPLNGTSGTCRDIFKNVPKDHGGTCRDTPLEGVSQCPDVPLGSNGLSINRMLVPKTLIAPALARPTKCTLVLAHRSSADARVSATLRYHLDSALIDITL